MRALIHYIDPVGITITTIKTHILYRLRYHAAKNIIFNGSMLIMSNVVHENTRGKQLNRVRFIRQRTLSYLYLH